MSEAIVAFTFGETESLHDFFLHLNALLLQKI